MIYIVILCCNRLTALLLGSILLLWQAGCSTTPDLPIEEAAKIITQTPQFNQRRTLVKMQSLLGKDDSACCWRSARFTFRSGSELIEANGFFMFDLKKRQWYLQHFSYGKPPRVTIIQCAPSFSE